MLNEYCTYRLWDSTQGFVDVAVNGWLDDAIVATGMTRPHRAQFWCNETGQWLNVISSALDRVCREVAE